MKRLLKKRFLLKYIFILFIFLILLFFHTRGFPYQDEGWFLQAGLRVFNGEIPYKDFQFVYTPGGIYANFLAFKFLGVSVLSSRLFALANSLLAIYLLYLIAQKLKFGTFLTTGLILYYLFWGPAHINFIWPVMLCLTTGILNIALFLYSDKKKFENLIFFLIGSVSALTFIFKQNFGFAVFLSNLTFFFFSKTFKKPKLVIFHFLGFFFVLLIQLSIFSSTKSLNWFISDFYNLTYLKIFKEGVYNSLLPWQYPSFILVNIAKTLFYMLPLFISLFAFFKTYFSKNKSLISIPIVTLLYYLFSIRPTTDYVHLTPLIAFSSLSLFLIYGFITKIFLKKLFTVSLFVLIVLGAWSALFRNYYRWTFPLIAQSTYIPDKRLEIFVNKESVELVNELEQFFLTNSRKEDTVFVYDYEPLIYFLLDKKNPTSYDYLHTGILTDDTNSEVIKTLNHSKIKYIITNDKIDNLQTPIAAYIRLNYSPVITISRYIIWENRPITRRT